MPHPWQMHICARCERLSASHWLIGVYIKLTSLNNVIYARLSVALACRIERETGGAVTRRELLPDIDWDPDITAMPDGGYVVTYAEYYYFSSANLFFQRFDAAGNV